MPSPEPTFFALLIVLAEATFAAGGAVGKFSLSRVDLFGFAVLRALGGFIGVLLLSILSGKGHELLAVNGSDRSLVIFSTALFVTGNILYVGALKYGNFSIVFPLVRSSPLFVLVLAVLLLKERITAPLLLSTLLILLGVILVSGVWLRKRAQQPPAGNRGVFLALGISVIDAAWIVASKATVHRVSPNALAFTQVSAYLLVSFVLALVFSRLQVVSRRQVALACGSGFLSWGIGDVIYLLALREVPAILAGLLSGTGILFSVAIGSLFFREELRREHIAGACLLVAGVTLAAVRGV